MNYKFKTKEQRIKKLLNTIKNQQFRTIRAVEALEVDFKDKEWMEQIPFYICHLHRAVYFYQFSALPEFPQTPPCCILEKSEGTIKGLRVEWIDTDED